MSEQRTDAEERLKQVLNCLPLAIDNQSVVTDVRQAVAARIAGLLATIDDLRKRLEAAEQLEQRARPYLQHMANCAINSCACCGLQIVQAMFRHRLTNECSCGLRDLFAAMSMRNGEQS